MGAEERKRREDHWKSKLPFRKSVSPLADPAMSRMLTQTSCDRLDVTGKKPEDVGMPFPEFAAHGGGTLPIPSRSETRDHCEHGL